MGKYKRIDFAERVKIKTLLEMGFSQLEISVRLGRHKSSISREIARVPLFFNPVLNQELARKKAHSRRGSKRKLILNQRLHRYVLCKLKKKWSPEQISVALRTEFSEDQTMRISHESIYTYIYLLPRGELRKELTGYLRQKKKSRYRRKGTNEKRGKIPEMISITERPAEVEDRSVAGHWEADLILGKRHASALGTIVERKTRAVILVPLKAKDAESVRKAFEKELKKLPQQMKLSLTYDQGREMTQHKLFTKNTKMKVFFCHPASPWERGTCENTNMLIRDYFPKKTEFTKISRKEIKRVQRELNERPRKTLDFQTPIDVFNQEILNQLR